MVIRWLMAYEVIHISSKFFLAECFRDARFNYTESKAHNSNIEIYSTIARRSVGRAQT